jgi:hypothetical protein
MWAMLGSNQRSLPCEGKSITPWLFAAVQKYLQMRAFLSSGIRACSQLFVWVGVLIGVHFLYETVCVLSAFSAAKACSC